MRLKMNYNALRTLKLFLCLTVVLSSLMLSNCNNSLLVNTKALSNDDTWTYYDSDSECYPYVDFSPFTSANKENYLINVYTPEQLAAVAVLVNHPDKSATLKDSNSNYASPRCFQDGTIMLRSDIDLGAHLWEPIGINNKNVFKGNFDGGKNTIKNLFIGETSDKSVTYSYVGLFGNTIGNISNVIIDSAKVYAKEDGLNCFHAGFIAGYICGNINNCYTNENSYLYYMVCSGNLKDYVGGITGVVFQGSILGCENNASIYGFLSDDAYISHVCVGGIAGTCNFSKIEKCTNNSNISDFQSSRYIGGIAGQVYCDGDIYNCHNYGFIRVSAMQSESLYHKLDSKAGGIIGYVQGFTFHEANVCCCVNLGKVCSFKLKKNIKDLNSSPIVGDWDDFVRLVIQGCYSSNH